MALQTSSFFIASFLIFLLLNPIPTPYSKEVRKEEEEFSYVEGSGKGPKHWGEIHEDWSACSKGRMQSPIDLHSKRVKVVHHLGRLKRSYKPANASLLNRGHDILLKWENEAGSIFLNGTEFFLSQCHWHSPSEHTINGRRYDLEVHMVHKSLDKKIAVVGILYKIGRPDTFLAELMDEIDAIRDMKDGRRNVGIIDPRHIKLGSRKYYRYEGSLTTPPCTEGVTWTIIRKVRTSSRAQVRLLREAVQADAEMNARPTQASNSRTVYLFSPRRIQV